MTPRYWQGSTDRGCDFCGDAFKRVFVDGRTGQGPWACMCKECFGFYGVGLGTGSGQEYTKQANGRWLKTGG